MHSHLVHHQMPKSLLNIEKKVPITFCIGIDKNLKQAELFQGKVSKGANYLSQVCYSGQMYKL